MMNSPTWLEAIQWLPRKPQIYASVPKDESESSMEERQEGPARPQRPLWKWLYCFLFISLAIGFVMLVSLYGGETSSLPDWYGVYPSGIENEPKILVEWQGDPRYSRDTLGSQIAWDNLIPPGLGHILVHDGEIASHGLGKGKPIPGKGTAYAVSGFHQIHCLVMIRESLFRFIERLEVPLYSSTDPSNLALNLTAHLDHCFDYLRQGIMCAADATIESTQKKPGQIGPGPEDEGWGNVHICRNWEALVGFGGAEDRRPSDLRGFSFDHYFGHGSHIGK